MIISYATNKARWQAIQVRDRGADGHFVFAVRTTGVYCRPSCASRAPLRGNVFFFRDWAAAQQAGFRPCKRCRPQGASAETMQINLIERACRLIEASEAPPRLAKLAGEIGLSPYHFHRLFKRVVGVTPREYAACARLRRFKEHLSNGNGKGITTAIYAAGFGSSSRAYESSHKSLGMAPATYRAGAPGEHIRFSIVPTRLGMLLVAVTRKGVCAIDIDEAADALRNRLRQRFPKARLEADDKALRRHIQAVVQYLDIPSRGLALPLDIRGTAFQQRIWRALTQIPMGATKSYSAIAKQLGHPGSARAVAAACAANPAALAIPCHRAVRENGDLAGYRWGVERKRLLLAAESARLPTTKHPLPRLDDGPSID